MKKAIITLTLFTCFVFASCKKDKTTEDQLPPATQTGANTFGCLVNGKVFVPKGYGGTGRPNPHILYDYDLQGKPFLAIETHQYQNYNSMAGIDISFFDIVYSGSYLLPNEFKLSIGSIEILGNCGISSLDSSVNRWGGGVITKLDIPNRIISGTFDCKFKRPQCDTVRVTNGRFDIKF
ncbi:MAG: hypothetical protein ABIU55_05300 [Ferruginibacter sp.]